jgi:hypothetical protein
MLVIISRKLTRTLILYTQRNLNLRQTVKQHLFSFQKDKGLDITYVNVINKFPKFLSNYSYDLLILHYSFLGGHRFFADEKLWLKKTKGIDSLNVKFKVAIPQDEFLYTDRLYFLFKKVNVDMILTTLYSDKDIKLFYERDKLYKPSIKKVLPGYLDESIINYCIKNEINFNDRKVDIGYRGRNLNYVCGEHGEQKYNLTIFFKSFFKDKNLKFDIENTDESNHLKNFVFTGEKWYDFLLSCKSVLGCEGGSSLYDKDGNITRKVKDFLKHNPKATFQDVKKKCFLKEDFLIENYALGPKNLEATASKTLQILVEGNYNNVLIPWRHYIPLKKDYSNIDVVIKSLSDTELCQKIINNAYKEIALNKDYTYSHFISLIKNNLPSEILNNQENLKINNILKIKVIVNNNLNLLKGELLLILKKIISVFIKPKVLKQIFY